MTEVIRGYASNGENLRISNGECGPRPIHFGPQLARSAAGSTGRPTGRAGSTGAGPSGADPMSMTHSAVFPAELSGIPRKNNTLLQTHCGAFGGKPFGGKPFGGRVYFLGGKPDDTAFRYSRDEGHEHVGISDISIGRTALRKSRAVGHIPLSGLLDNKHHISALPAHLQGRSSSTVSPTSLPPRKSNSMRTAVPNSTTNSKFGPSSKFGGRRTRSLKVIPRVPGLMTHIPGVQAEVIYGSKFGITNARGQELRERNPFGRSAWITRDPVDALKFMKLIPGSSNRELTKSEEDYATLCAMETKLGAVELTEPMGWTKYMASSAMGLSYDPELHGKICGSKKKAMERSQKNKKSDNDRIGCRTFYGGEQIEAQRWQTHMWFNRDRSCGSIRGGALICPH